MKLRSAHSMSFSLTIILTFPIFSILTITLTLPMFSILTIILTLTLSMFRMKEKGIVYGKERQAELSCEIADSTTTHFPE